MNENDKSETTYQNKCSILSELWLEYRNSESFTQLITYGDLGFPLAYAVSAGIIESNDNVSKFVNELWEMFISIIGAEDNGWTNLNDLLTATFDDDIE